MSRSKKTGGTGRFNGARGKRRLDRTREIRIRVTAQTWNRFMSHAPDRSKYPHMEDGIRACMRALGWLTADDETNYNMGNDDSGMMG